MRLSTTTFALLFLGFASLGRAEKNHFEVGEAVPMFSLKAINPDDSGESYVSLDKYVGGEAKAPKKAVLVSFFATYCEPCKKEMPFLSALFDTYKDKGLQILSITIDKENDKVEFAKNLAKEKGAKFPVLSDRFNIVAKRYLIEKLPNVYVLDGAGKVTMVKVGYAGDVTRSLLDEVRKNLGEPMNDPVPAAIQPFLTAHEAAPEAQVAPTGDAAAQTPAADDAAATKGKKAKGKGKKAKTK